MRPNIFLGIIQDFFISEKIQETLVYYNVDARQISAVFHDEASNAVLSGEWGKGLIVAIGVMSLNNHHATLFCRKDFMLSGRVLCVLLIACRMPPNICRESMQRLLAKCRHLVGHFKHSALATVSLMKKQKTLGFTKMLQEVLTSWNSTFYMLQRLVLLKQPIRLYLEDTMTEVD